MKFKIFLTTTLIFSCLNAQESSSGKIRALYNAMDPTSISQHLAFYDLYSETPEGQKALQEAFKLLNARNQYTIPPQLLLGSVNAIVSLVNKLPGEDAFELSEEELNSIEQLGAHLPNRRLRGHGLTSELEILKLEPNEIDVARGVLLSQLGNDPTAIKKIRSYEATIDLMALQILARVPMDAPPKAKIRAINHYIFEEMGFRFPPHSTFAKDVDLYTFLPSVLDSRKGVCLGVSILYLCLSQRLNLDLEIVTPPGHIYVRWKNGNQTINIETTARGIHLPDEEYLGIDVRKLQERNIKETIGMAHVNQASVFWEREEYDKALNSYLKARPYLPQDDHTLELMGIVSVLSGDEEKGREYLNQVVGYLPDYAVSKETIPEDYLNGAANKEALQATFKRVDKTRESLIKKKDALENALKTSPNFRDGIFSLAGTWLQLHRAGEALEWLKRYHQIDSNNSTVEYYLSALYAERHDFNNAWMHFRNAEKLVKERNHDPKALNELQKALAEICPE